MDNFDLKKYLAEGRLLKENTEEEINRVKNIIEKNYDFLISQYVSEGYDENELKMYYDYLLNPNSMEDMGKLEFLRSYSIESLFPSHQTPISKRSDNNILEELSPVGRLRRKKGAAKSNDPSFIKAKRGLKQIFQQMLSGELSGKEANNQISDFTFGQGSMGIYPDSNTLFIRQFGMGGGDFNDYVIGKFENGGFTPASQPKNKTALKVWNYLSNLNLAEGRLLKEKMSLEVDDDYIELSADSGEYDGDLNDDGTVDFSVFYDDGTEFDESNWKSILGEKHVFVKISNKIPTKVEAAGDYVMITVDLEDLKNLIKPNKSKNMKNLGSYETKDSKGNIVKRYI